jgi:hypothetical protein
MPYDLLNAVVTFFISLLLFQGASIAQEIPTPAAIASSLSAPKGKLSFRLDALTKYPALNRASDQERGMALSMRGQGMGSLIRDALGRVMINIRLDDLSTANIQELRNRGARIVHVSDRYKVVTALVDPVDFSAVGEHGSVKNLREVLKPAKMATCPSGAIVSEGNTQLKAALARSNYGVDGSGVTVGVLSDSYNNLSGASADVATFDLPGTGNTCGYTTPVYVFSDYASGGDDEGRAMLQIVHDLAPGASLSFATAYVSLTSFADNIRSLRSAGADIIVDDILWFDEPFFQEGPVSVAISDVVSSGALYFTAAGNYNLSIGGNYISSYEAPGYRATTCPSGLPAWAGATCHDFDPTGGTSSTSSVTLLGGCTVDILLQWNEPWYGVATDLDLFLIDSKNVVVSSSAYDNLNDEPFEYLSYTNSSGSAKTYRIVVNRYTGSGTPRLKYVFLQNGNDCISSVQYNTSAGGDIVGPSLIGHGSSVAGFSVAAVPFDDSNNPEYYTSRGPATHYYGPVVGTTPASAITPQTIQQPDFAATDGGCTTFFGRFSLGCNRFYGTSAAAPHAAAVAALLKQKANQLSMSFTRAVAKHVLQSSAQAVSGGDLNSVGSGLLDANAAMAKLLSLESVIRVQGSTVVGGYAAIQTAYNNSASSGDIIEAVATTFNEDLVLSSNVSITLKGGYAPEFGSQSGSTTLQGSLLISSGTVIIENVIIK